jgi:hypothetical protein
MRGEYWKELLEEDEREEIGDLNFDYMAEAPMCNTTDRNDIGHIWAIRAPVMHGDWCISSAPSFFEVCCDGVLLQTLKQYFM